MQAVQAMATKAGVPWIVPVLATIPLNALGGVAAGLPRPPGCRSSRASTASCRRVFGELHPRWRTPYVALLVQAAIAVVFVFLGQAGTSVRGAYEALVSMGIIANFIPFLFMFAAMIKLQREPAGPEVIRVPGGAASREAARRPGLSRQRRCHRAGLRAGGR